VQTAKLTQRKQHKSKNLDNMSSANCRLVMLVMFTSPKFYSNFNRSTKNINKTFLLIN